MISTLDSWTLTGCMQPALAVAEVLDSFPERRLLINIKSNDPSEGELLARYLLARPELQRRRLMVYGGKLPVDRFLSLVPGVRGLSRESAISCGTRYALVGWSGYVPSACRNTLLILPENRARLLWGWPHRFIARMQTVGTDVYVAASSDGAWLSGIDSDSEFKRIAADNYTGGIWTDRIETLGPLNARE